MPLSNLVTSLGIHIAFDGNTAKINKKQNKTRKNKDHE